MFIANSAGRETSACQSMGSLFDTCYCSSFSKCLVPGFRIGWVAGGSHARQIQRLQLMSTLSHQFPMQLALVVISRHVDMTRICADCERLAERKQQLWQTLLRHLGGVNSP